MMDLLQLLTALSEKEVREPGAPDGTGTDGKQGFRDLGTEEPLPVNRSPLSVNRSPFSGKVSTVNGTTASNDPLQPKPLQPKPLSPSSAWQSCSVVGITQDSRCVQPGFVFVCISGYQLDGHDYIEDAIRRGAVAVVIEEAAEPYSTANRMPLQPSLTARRNRCHCNEPAAEPKHMHRGSRALQHSEPDAVATGPYSPANRMPLQRASRCAQTYARKQDTEKDENNSVPLSLCPSVPVIIIVKNGREALALLSAAFYQYPSRNLRVIGITGTNGKTTTSYLVASILESAGYSVGLTNTLTCRIKKAGSPCSEETAAVRTTPESVDLQRTLRHMVDQGCQYAVVEVSSHSLVLNRVLGCEFDVGVLTNITSDHLDFHKTLAEYREAKLRLFSGLGSGDPLQPKPLQPKPLSFKIPPNSPMQGAGPSPMPYLKKGEGDDCSMKGGVSSPCDSHSHSNSSNKIPQNPPQPPLQKGEHSPPFIKGGWGDYSIKQSKAAILNLDDPSFSVIEENTKCPVFSYGFQAEAQIRADRIIPSQSGIAFEVHTQALPKERQGEGETGRDGDGETERPGDISLSLSPPVPQSPSAPSVADGAEPSVVSTFKRMEAEPYSTANQLPLQRAASYMEIISPLTGLHNVSNILAAIGVGLAEGIDPAKIREGIRKVSHVPGRFETIDCGQDFWVVVDFAHTADALQNLLQTARHLGPARIITVFGCGGDRDQSKRFPMGQVAATLSDCLIITNDNSRSEDPAAIARQIEEGVCSVDVCSESVNRDPLSVKVSAVNGQRSTVNGQRLSVADGVCSVDEDVCSVAEGSVLSPQARRPCYLTKDPCHSSSAEDGVKDPCQSSICGQAVPVATEFPSPCPLPPGESGKGDGPCAGQENDQENDQGKKERTKKECHLASCKYEIILDRFQAIQKALSWAEPGDMVLIAGKGHEQYQVIGSQCIPFDDRQVARHILNGLTTVTTQVDRQ